MPSDRRHGVSAIPTLLGDGWLTTKQAAEILDRDVRTIGRWVERGILPSRRVGGRRYFKRSDMVRFVTGDSEVNPR